MPGASIQSCPDELLAAEVYDTLAEAKTLEQIIRNCNSHHRRPHSSLGYNRHRAWFAASLAPS